MIDLDKIEQQCKNAMQNGYGHLPVIECGNAVKVMELITRIRKAEKDAERYRWLRQQPCSGWEVDGDETSLIDVTMWRNDGFDNFNSGESLSGGQMDAAIDEAMQCNK